MTTSGDTFPRKLTTIDDLSRPDHYYLSSVHSCLFLGEYTARKGFSFSPTNQIVLNFKKSMDRRGRPEWQHKERAIRDLGHAFGTAISAEWLMKATLVPMPPSKAKGDPLYDDRMIRMLRSIPTSQQLDVRELLLQQSTMVAAHDASVRPSPNDIATNLRINESAASPAPQTIAIFDDVLTTGAHFVAAHAVLSHRFPGARIFGFFVARRVPETSDFEEFLDP